MALVRWWAHSRPHKDIFSTTGHTSLCGGIGEEFDKVITRLTEAEIRRSSSTSVIVHSIPTGRGRTGSLNKCKVSIVGKLSSPHQIKLIKLDWGKPWEVTG